VSQVTDRLRTPLYLVAFVFAVTPIVDIITNVLPLQFGAAPWRFGATGVASNYLVSILFGGALAAALAIDGGRRGTVIVLSMLNALAFLVLVVLALSLLLDTIQLHRDVPPDTERMFVTGVVKSQFKLIMAALTFGAFGWALFRHARATRKTGEAEPAFLVRESKGTKKP
jgi:hypothetical protein